MKFTLPLISSLLFFNGAVVTQSAELPVDIGVGRVPDYEANFKQKRSYEKTSSTRSVLHRDGWSRVETVRAGDTSTTFGNADVSLRVYGPQGSKPVGMQLYNTSASSDYYFKIRGIKPTGQSERHGKLSCKYHEITRQPERELSAPTYLSCVASNGIEIGERVLSSVAGPPMSETSLVSLTYRQVSVREVAPQAEWFDARHWLEPMRFEISPDIAHPDFVMTLQGDHGQLMIWRRHFPWNYQEIRELDGSRSVKTWNEVERRGLYFDAIKAGVFRQLFATRPTKPVRSSGYFGEGMTPKLLDRAEAVLGETCRWFDMTPEMADASHHQCMNSDNIALRVNKSSGWGSGSRFAAISLMRRAVSLEELLPDPEILRASNWGIEETR